MRKTLLSSLACVALVAASTVFAQVSVTIGQPEQARIKEYVIREKVKPTMMKERIGVGTMLPADVQFAPAPPEWGASVSKYGYIYTDQHVVLVDPTTRRVVHVIE